MTSVPLTTLLLCWTTEDTAPSLVEVLYDFFQMDEDTFLNYTSTKSACLAP